MQNEEFNFYSSIEMEDRCLEDYARICCEEMQEEPSIVMEESRESIVHEGSFPYEATILAVIAIAFIGLIIYNIVTFGVPAI